MKYKDRVDVIVHYLCCSDTEILTANKIIETLDGLSLENKLLCLIYALQDKYVDKSKRRTKIIDLVVHYLTYEG
ncbi:MAG: hypothetical protein WC877_01130 [Dehalococcoidales bacterium]|jgi:hypothetical protein